MKNKQTLFFATASDMRPILMDLEKTFPVQYFKTGLFDSKGIPEYESVNYIPRFGSSDRGDWNHTDTYLIVPEGSKIKVRDIEQIKGGIKYAVDQMANPQSVEFKMSVIYKGRDAVLVAGRVATISEGKFSMEIYKAFSSTIKKTFQRNESFYLGSEAFERLRAGWRLVTNEKSPKEFDLILK